MKNRNSLSSKTGWNPAQPSRASRRDRVGLGGPGGLWQAESQPTSGLGTRRCQARVAGPAHPARATAAL
jgi:hypothetical protein